MNHGNLHVIQATRSVGRRVRWVSAPGDCDSSLGNHSHWNDIELFYTVRLGCFYPFVYVRLSFNDFHDDNLPPPRRGPLWVGWHGGPGLVPGGSGLNYRWALIGFSEGMCVVSIDVFCHVYISYPRVPVGSSECPPAKRVSCGVDLFVHCIDVVYRPLEPNLRMLSYCGPDLTQLGYTMT